MELSRNEIKELDFSDDRVKAVVLQSLSQGAKVTKRDDKFFYYDPFYSSEEIEISRIRYSKELGLYHD